MPFFNEEDIWNLSQNICTFPKTGQMTSVGFIEEYGTFTHKKTNLKKHLFMVN